MGLESCKDPRLSLAGELIAWFKDPDGNAGGRASLAPRMKTPDPSSPVIKSDRFHPALASAWS
jgi:hypothetical protein